MTHMNTAVAEMGMFMRSFCELLPYRIAQFFSTKIIRKCRVWFARRGGVEPLQLQIGKVRRLYIDLAVITKHDAGTGIQRVVRALALGVIDEAPTGWEICFVDATRRRGYHRISWPNMGLTCDFGKMEGRPGDVFVGLDFSLDAVRQHRKQLIRFRRNGGVLWFLVHDLLPVERPDWFSHNTVIRYKAWLDIIACNAYGFLCNSTQTEADLVRVFSNKYALKDGYRTEVLPMGSSILDSTFQVSAGSSSFTSSRFVSVQPYCLMVGTLEPRKGHADVLAAFSLLWHEGYEQRLVLVGRMGWMTEHLREQILAHPEYGHKLFWFDDVDDLELTHAYAASQGVIVASYAEGFGLPLTEALGYGRPVLARDLVVFRPHEDCGVRYFSSDTDLYALARCVRQWTADVQAGRIIVTNLAVPWRSSAKALLSAIQRDASSYDRVSSSVNINAESAVSSE